MYTIADDTGLLLISIYLKRDQHDNGMTLQEYADGVVAGTCPVLEHDDYVYQFGAIADELNLVLEWAYDNKLQVVEASTESAVVKVHGTVKQLNDIFEIELLLVIDDNYQYYTHLEEITLPTEINSVVEAVLGLDNLVKFSHNAILDTSIQVIGDLAPTGIAAPTPVDLALAYKFPRSPGSNLVQGKGTCVSIIALGGGWTNQNLTSTFSRISQPNPTIVDVSVDGGVNDGGIDANSSGEVMLDIYCVGAIVPAAKIAMYFAPNSYQGFINTIIAATNDTVNNPSVISISWGTTDTNFSTVTRNLFESALQSAAVKGITVFAAAGDYGTKAISTASYGTLGYPQSSPYVVSCGGTVISINNDYSIASERAWGGLSDGGFAGGGGTSTIFSIPVWQTGKGYTTQTYSGTVANLTTRSIPDISAMATGYTFNYSSSNSAGTFLGTSAVAPLLAGMMARLNQLTGRRLGFVNSDWYAAQATAFNDITTGLNTLSSATTGYSATASWDACTGLGSPKGDALYKLYKTGSTFPKLNYGFRPTTGQTYPRKYTGVR